MSRTILGARIRERRRHLGITQAELARRLQISASYLNLIEHNKRGIAGSLLRQTAEALDLTPEELDGAAERRLLETLEDIALSPAIAALGAEHERTGELIGRFPGWARALAALSRAEHEATDVARSFADRISHDPFLGETVHRMLTQIAALRSAAEILVEYPEASDEQRDRFVSILCDESHALSEVGMSLTAYFDTAEKADHILTPQDEVEAMFEARENHFAEIESAAAALTLELLENKNSSALAQRRSAAHALAERALGETFEAIIERQAQITSEPAQRQAHEALLEYASHALLAPLELFEPRARELRYDVELLADSFAVDIDTVCQRLSALPAGHGRPRFGYFRANAAGSIVQHRNLPDLAAPQQGASCPLWALYRAQQTPGAALFQRAAFPSGEHFVMVAWAHNGGEAGFGQPRHYLSDMLAIRESDARHTVYAAHDEQAVELVGSSCRTCTHRDCHFRVAEPLSV